MARRRPGARNPMARGGRTRAFAQHGVHRFCQGGAPRGPRPRLSRKKGTPRRRPGVQTWVSRTSSAQASRRTLGCIPRLSHYGPNPFPGPPYPPEPWPLPQSRGPSTRKHRLERRAPNLLQRGRFTRPQRQHRAGQPERALQRAAQLITVSIIVHAGQLHKQQVGTALRVLTQVLAHQPGPRNGVQRASSA